jgi:hypothetical protein
MQIFFSIVKNMVLISRGRLTIFLYTQEEGLGQEP